MMRTGARPGGQLALVALTAAVVGLVGSRAVGARQGQAVPTAAAQPTAQAIAQAEARGLNYVPGDVIFKFKKNTPTYFQQRALGALRSRPSLAAVHWTDDVGLIHDDTQSDGRVLAQQLAEQGEIEFASPNYIRHVRPLAYRAHGAAVTALPAEAASPSLSGARASAQTTTAATFTPNDPDYAFLQWDLPLIGMPGAWGINQGGSPSIIVAVLDTGVTSVAQTLTEPLWNGTAFVQSQIPFSKSPDLSASRIVHPIDLVFSNNNNVLDMDGHATHVASTIGEDTNNDYALAGIAFNVKIMPIKVCTGYWETMIQMGQANIPGFADPNTAGGCPDSAIIEGMHNAADAGAQVINISLGGDEPDPGLQDAMNYAVGKGSFIAVAMGNDYENGNPTEYPAFYAAGINGAMSVAAVDVNSNHASYSSGGSYCEISAPGGDGPESALNSFVWQVTLDFTTSDPSLLVPTFNVYAEIGMNGTSMATPHISGVAALIFSQYPKITPAAVEALIKNTAERLGAAESGPDVLYGFGLVQARQALFGLGIAK